jgi:hypothetical protein
MGPRDDNSRKGSAVAAEALSMASNGGYVACAESDPSLVSDRHGVGYGRSRGDFASRVSRSIGECRMPLWLALVVRPQAAMSHAILIRIT